MRVVMGLELETSKLKEDWVEKVWVREREKEIEIEEKEFHQGNVR